MVALDYALIPGFDAMLRELGLDPLGLLVEYVTVTFMLSYKLFNLLVAFAIHAFAIRRTIPPRSPRTSTRRRQIQHLERFILIYLHAGAFRPSYLFS